MNIFIKILITALAAFFAAFLLPGVHIINFGAALILAVVLGVLNLFIKPILIILTLPVTVFTLGIFLLVINALIILIASSIVGGVHVDGFWWALFFSILLSIISGILEGLGQRRQEDEI